MMMVDIYVPGVGQTYDFNVDENAKISLLIEELAGMICQKEQCTLSGNIKELLLVSLTRNRMLNPGLTLLHYKIGQGERLMLV